VIDQDCDKHGAPPEVDVAGAVCVHDQPPRRKNAPLLDGFRAEERKVSAATVLTHLPPSPHLLADGVNAGLCRQSRSRNWSSAHRDLIARARPSRDSVSARRAASSRSQGENGQLKPGIRIGRAVRHESTITSSARSQRLIVTERIDSVDRACNARDR
jgi:hypothetical protein